MGEVHLNYGIRACENRQWYFHRLHLVWSARFSVIPCIQPITGQGLKTLKNMYNSLRYNSIFLGGKCKLSTNWESEYRRSPHFVIFGTKRVSRNSGITNFETLFSIKSQIRSKNFLKSTILANFSFKTQLNIRFFWHIFVNLVFKCLKI